ncbi:hypothetical protein HELRODRAFT_167781 [Helobdella robusta]|uniref:Uncharacterized protein n=1 Tax=Helobdella robusta TaxID=6412 RepID=T1EZS7_HELRO|nr:hypothetical protein HELRODRAFT_167781 [Helobdella robusta]ESO09951.1 hypothetical protein HELRODRAFT_167781 [Helobdella robusta]
MHKQFVMFDIYLATSGWHAYSLEPEEYVFMALSVIYDVYYIGRAITLQTNKVIRGSYMQEKNCDTILIGIRAADESPVETRRVYSLLMSPRFPCLNFNGGNRLRMELRLGTKVRVVVSVFGLLVALVCVVIFSIQKLLYTVLCTIINVQYLRNKCKGGYKFLQAMTFISLPGIIVSAFGLFAYLVCGFLVYKSKSFSKRYSLKSLFQLILNAVA